MREWNSPVLVWGAGEMLGLDLEVNEQEQRICIHGTWYSCSFHTTGKLSCNNILVFGKSFNISKFLCDSLISVSTYSYIFLSSI